VICISPSSLEIDARALLSRESIKSPRRYVVGQTTIGIERTSSKEIVSLNLLLLRYIDISAPLSSIDQILIPFIF
jgi:hypothetical protein